MTRAHKVYTPEEQAAALAVLRAADGNLSEAQRQTGIDRRSIRAWAQNTPELVAQIAQDKSESLAAMFERTVRMALGIEAMGLAWIALDGTGELASKHLSDANRIAGTGTEKIQLLTGEPTSRTEYTVDVDLATAD